MLVLMLRTQFLFSFLRMYSLIFESENLIIYVLHVSVLSVLLLMLTPLFNPPLVIVRPLLSRPGLILL